MKEIVIPDISLAPLRVLTEHEGGFSRVLVVSAIDGQKYALKILKTSIGIDREFLYAEALKLVSIPDHPNVINILGVFRHDYEPLICLPYYPTSLRTAIQKRTYSNNSAIIEAALQIASGLNHLHNTAKLLHSDLKPENILVSAQGHLVITDFGLSRHFIISNDEKNLQKYLMSTPAGTLAYLSPEFLVTGKASAKSDIFAFGIILFELITNRHPFLSSSLEETLRNILIKDSSFSFIKKFRTSKILISLCKWSLEKNPDKRPTAKDICQTLGGNSQIHFNSLGDKPDLWKLVHKAVTLATLKRYSEAEKLYLRCLDLNYWFIAAHINLAQVYSLQGKFEDAIASAETALTLFTRVPTDRASLATLYVNLSNYYLMKDPEKALSIARTACAISPNDWQALGNLAESCRLVACHNKDQVLIAEGLNACHKGLSINPDDVVLRVNLGNLLLLSGNLRDLVEVVATLTKHAAHRDMRARVLVIETLIAVGEIDGAEMWLSDMKKYGQYAGIVGQLEKSISEKRHKST